MELWAWILIIVLVSLVGLYLISFIVVISFVLSFKKRIDKRTVTISLLLSQKHDLILDIQHEFHNRKIALTEQIKQYIANIEPTTNILDMDKKERDEILNEYARVTSGFSFLAESTDIREKSKNYRELELSLSDVEETYRYNVAIYNSDVTGYNYWTSILFFKTICKLLKFTPKEIIL